MYASSAQPQPVKWPQLINRNPSCLLLLSYNIRVEYMYMFLSKKKKRKKKKKNSYCCNRKTSENVKT